jgi:lipoprotein-releasing system ATP-binding protein
MSSEIDTAAAQLRLHDATPAPVTSSPVLRGIGLRKKYRSGTSTLEVLRGVDVELAAGEFVAIVGQSGSGKTTLLHLLGLLDAPDGGEVHLAGTRIDTLSSSKQDLIRNTQIGMVFQSYHLLPELDAVENVLAPLYVRYGMLEWLRRRHDARQEAVALLERFGLGARLSHRPRQLSGGEMQRVAIARALIARPQLLLADEPTGNLDAASGAGILETLTELNQSDGLSIVMVTHDTAIAARAGRVIKLADGCVEQQLTTPGRSAHAPPDFHERPARAGG